ncbi:hypothetical protein EGW08_003034 [Elysia chlorotica]|uniref:SMB domain-containing protein n=1 Tax=Elysia chlorotica TaxID=188477 RepID=A0A433U5Y7_ELYCH|nr:hypothetical protein EGW08_003034 [Elysia chlorotica]
MGLKLDPPRQAILFLICLFNIRAEPHSTNLTNLTSAEKERPSTHEIFNFNVSGSLPAISSNEFISSPSEDHGVLANHRSIRNKSQSEIYLNCSNKSDSEISQSISEESHPEIYHGVSNESEPEFYHGSSNESEPEFYHGSSNESEPEFYHGSSNESEPEFYHGSSNESEPDFYHGSSKPEFYHGSSNESEPDFYHGSSKPEFYHGSSNESEPDFYHGSSKPEFYHGSSNESEPDFYHGSSNESHPEIYHQSTSNESQSVLRCPLSVLASDVQNDTILGQSVTDGAEKKIPTSENFVDLSLSKTGISSLRSLSPEEAANFSKSDVKSLGPSIRESPVKAVNFSKSDAKSLGPSIRESPVKAVNFSKSDAKSFGRPLSQSHDEATNFSKPDAKSLRLPTTQRPSEATNFSKSDAKRSGQTRMTPFSEMCAVLERSVGLSCLGRCGSSPEMLTDLGFVACACDSACWIYDDCCQDMDIACPSHHAEGRAKYPSIKHALSSCFYNVQYLYYLKTVQTTSWLTSFGTTIWATGHSNTQPTTFRNTDEDGRYKPIDATQNAPRLQLFQYIPSVRNIFFVADESLGLLFDYEAMADGYFPITTNMSYIPYQLFFDCGLPTFTLMDFESIAAYCEVKFFLDIPLSLQRPCCVDEYMVCDSIVVYNPLVTCSTNNPRFSESLKCGRRSPCLQQKFPRLESRTYLNMTIHPGESYYIVNFPTLLETSITCKSLNAYLKACAVDTCLQGAVLLVDAGILKEQPEKSSTTRSKFGREHNDLEMPPDKATTTSRSKYSRKADVSPLKNGIPLTKEADRCGDKNKLIVERRRCLMPTGIIIRYIDETNGYSNTNAADVKAPDISNDAPDGKAPIVTPASCACVLANVAFGRLGIWTAIIRPGDECRISLNLQTSDPDMGNPELCLTSPSYQGKNRDIYSFSDLSSQYQFVSELCVDWRHSDRHPDQTRSTWRAMACFIPDTQYHKPDEPEVCVFLPDAHFNNRKRYRSNGVDKLFR